MSETYASPTHVDDRNWFYDEPEGFLLVHQVLVRGVVSQTDQVTIPWALVRLAVARHDRRKLPRTHKVGRSKKG